jgi:enamine deaminase RidA (YjgF/YER057c/UK114 family)
MTRRNIASGAPWEALVGYSRAVQVGDQVFVAGTTSTAADGTVVGRGDAYAQTRHALARIEAALAEAGFALADVVRSRIYVTDIDRWRDVGRAHAEVFGQVRPAATMVEVRRLVSPDMLVEIEVEAVRAAPAPEAVDRGAGGG